MRTKRPCSWVGIVQCIHRQKVSTFLVFLSTQTNKRQRTHLTRNVYRKRKEGEFHIIVLCHRLTDKQREAQEHTQQNTENIWNSSLVTNSVLIFIKQLWLSYMFNFDSRTKLIWIVWMVKFNRRLKLSGQSLSRTNPIRRHSACNWAVGLRRGGSRSCVCELFERAAVGYKTEWFGYRWTEHCDVSRNQHSVVSNWHLNLYKSLCECVLVVSSMKSHSRTFYTCWSCLCSRFY